MSNQAGGLPREGSRLVTWHPTQYVTVLKALSLWPIDLRANGQQPPTCCTGLKTALCMYQAADVVATRVQTRAEQRNQVTGGEGRSGVIYVSVLGYQVPP